MRQQILDQLGDRNKCDDGASSQSSLSGVSGLSHDGASSKSSLSGVSGLADPTKKPKNPVAKEPKDSKALKKDSIIDDGASSQ